MVVAAAIGYGTLGPLAELARAEGVSSLTFAAGRSLFAAAAVVMFAALMRGEAAHESPLRARLVGDARRTLVLVGVMSAFVNLALVAAVARTSVAATLLIFYTYPAMVALAGLWWLGERLSRRQWAALAIALVGCVMVVSGPAAQITITGLLYAFGAAIGGAVFVIAARHGLGRVTALESSAVILSISALCLITAFVATGGLTTELGTVTPAGLALVTFAALTSGALPTGLFIGGIQRIGASPAAGLATLEPVAGATLAGLLLHQVLSVPQYVGGALVIVAALVLQTVGAVESVRPPEIQGG